MLLWLLIACDTAPRAPEPPPASVEAPRPAAWPSAGAPVREVETPAPHVARLPRLVLDAGHGAPGNPGATSVRCEEEQAVMLRVADAVAPRLGPLVDLRLARPDDRLVDYGARIAAAERWPADALVGLHFDARTGAALYVDPDTGCRGTTDAWGFAVLWSDEGPPELVAARQRLARAVAARLVQTGIPAYDGADYGAYEGDPAHPGVFVDRHAPRQRIRMLRRPDVPSILIETHNGLDAEEVERWDEARTHAAFASALRAALLDLAAAGEWPYGG